jgi:hypothetical protein
MSIEPLALAAEVHTYAGILSISFFWQLRKLVK